MALELDLDGTQFASPWTEREGRLLFKPRMSLMLFALELMVEEADESICLFTQHSKNSSCRHSQGKGGA